MATTTAASSDAEAPFDAQAATSRVARVYAEALSRSAGDQAEALADELDVVVGQGLATKPQVLEFLGSAAVNRNEKLPILAKALESNTSETFRRFVGVLNANRRLALLPAIASEYRRLQDRLAGRVRVRVTAASELTTEQRDSLTATLAKALGGQPILHIAVDPDILGGLIVQVGDTVYDTSVRARLESLRTHLLASGTHG